MHVYVCENSVYNYSITTNYIIDGACAHDRTQACKLVHKKLRCTAGVGWSSRGSKVCVTMLALQCQC